MRLAISSHTSSMLMALFARKHTTSTVSVRERIRKAQRNVTIRIPFSALSKETQGQLISYQEEEQEHKRMFAARKLGSFKFCNEDFDANLDKEDFSESSMSRYVAGVHAEEEKHKVEDDRIEKREDNMGIGRYSVPVPNVPEEIEAVDVDLLDH